MYEIYVRVRRACTRRGYRKHMLYVHKQGAPDNLLFKISLMSFKFVCFKNAFCIRAFLTKFFFNWRHIWDILLLNIISRKYQIPKNIVQEEVRR